MHTAGHADDVSVLPRERRRRGRHRLQHALALLTSGFVAAAGAVVAAPGASASPSASITRTLRPAVTDCDAFEAARGPNPFSVDFNYSAGLQHWVVPPNVADGSVCIDVSGGQGGAGAGSPGEIGRASCRERV